jgi:PKD repeat protein
VGPQPAATATHTYTGKGTFTVTVTVTDAAGLTSTATQQISATLVGPTAAASVAPSAGNAPVKVTVDASGSKAGSAPITGSTFDFGDGTTPVTGTAATGAHTYTAPGTYTVTTTAVDANGVKSVVTNQVVVLGSVAVSNGDFETGTLSGWSASYNAGVTTTNPHGGTYAGQIDAPTGGSGSIEQVISGLTPNTSYTLTGWIRTDGGTTILGAKNYDAADDDTGSTTTATTWTQLGNQFTTGPTNTSVDVYCYRSTAGTSACDDFTLTTIPAGRRGRGQWRFRDRDPCWLGRLLQRRRHTLTGWVRTDGSATILGAKQYGTAGNKIEVTTTNTAWTQLTDQFTTGASSTSVDIYCSRSTAGTSASDDITLTKR